MACAVRSGLQAGPRLFKRRQRGAVGDGLGAGLGKKGPVQVAADAVVGLALGAKVQRHVRKRPVLDAAAGPVSVAAKARVRVVDGDVGEVGLVADLVPVSGRGGCYLSV